MTDYPLIVSIVQMVTALATLAGILSNTIKINRTDKNVHTIKEQTADRKTDKES